jgi:hypothetical protein
MNKFLFALVFFVSSAYAADPDAATILEKAEQIRNPSEDYVCRVELVDKKGSKQDVTRTFESSIKGRDKALVRYLSPAEEKNTKVLMVGQDMWVKTESNSKPIRISANQKLTGNAAYGDVARLSFVGNYTPTLLRKDKFKGEEAYVLKLESIVNRPVTYDKVEYWVSTKSYRPLKALYMTFSDKIIREGGFEDYKDVFGMQRPTTFTLINLLQKDHTTTLKFSEPKKASLPDLLFEKQNLGRQ